MVEEVGGKKGKKVQQEKEVSLALAKRTRLLTSHLPEGNKSVL